MTTRSQLLPLNCPRRSRANLHPRSDGFVLSRRSAECLRWGCQALLRRYLLPGRRARDLFRVGLGLGLEEAVHEQVAVVAAVVLEIVQSIGWSKLRCQRGTRRCNAVGSQISVYRS